MKNWVIKWLGNISSVSGVKFLKTNFFIRREVIGCSVSEKMGPVGAQISKQMNAKPFVECTKQKSPVKFKTDVPSDFVPIV